MNSVMKILVAAAALGAALYLFVLPDFFSARGAPGALETWAINRLRHLAITNVIRDRRNPFPPTAEVLNEAREHFADHCAICHGNDGRGHTDMGPNFYPPVPDMTEAPTQALTDGELFYVIANGVRFSGMPAWGSNTREDIEATWKLVHFVRHLPQISREEILEMEKANPKSPADMEEEKADEQFLDGGELKPHTH